MARNPLDILKEDRLKKGGSSGSASDSSGSPALDILRENRLKTSPKTNTQSGGGGTAPADEARKLTNQIELEPGQTIVLDGGEEKKPDLFTRFSNSFVGNKTIQLGDAVIRGGKTFVDVWGEAVGDIRENGAPTKQELQATAGELNQGIINVGRGFLDFFTKEAPKAVTTLISMTMNQANANAAQLKLPSGEPLFPQPDFLIEGRKNIANFFDDVTEHIEREQHKKQVDLGIAGEDVSILNPRKFGYTIGSGVGSIAFAIGTGAASKSNWVASSLLGWVEGSDTYNDSRQALREDHPEMTEDEINSRATALALTDSAGVALLEKVGLDMLFRSYGGGFLYNRAVNAITETTQENTQSIWSFLVAKYGYNREKDLVQELIENTVTVPFIGMFGGQGAQYATDPQLVDDVADKMGLEKEEAQELLKETMPLIDEFVETQVSTGKVFQEQEEARDVLVKEVATDVQEKGEEAVKTELIENGLDEESAQSIVEASDIEKELLGDSDLLDQIAQAEQAVSQQSSTKKTPVKTEVAKEGSTEAQQQQTQDTSKKPVDVKAEAQEVLENTGADLQQDAFEARQKEIETQLEGKTSAELRDIGREQGALLDKTEGKERRSAVEVSNAVRDRLNEIRNKEKVSVLDVPIGGKNVTKLAEIDTVQLSDGTFQVRAGGNIGTSGFGSPFGGSFKTEEEAIAEGIKKIRKLIADVERDTPTKKAQTQINKVAKQLDELEAERGIDGAVDSGKIKGDDKTKPKSKNTKRDVRSKDDSKRGEDVREGSEGDGGTSTEDSGSVARGEGESGSASTGERSQQDIEAEQAERIEALNYEESDLEQIVNQKTDVSNDGSISISDTFTEEERAIISAYKPAGGRESQGARGRGLLDEYFTPEQVVEMTSSILSSVGALKDGMKILEPSVGIGNFVYGLPTSADVTGLEINELTARIAKINHNKMRVELRPFETLFMSDRGSRKDFKAEYDLVIGNPPYGSHRGKFKGLGEEPKITKYEEYFIKRALDVTKEGGHVAMVVPSGFLRSGISHAKEQMALNAEFVTAYRLPNGSFHMTDIGTDIIVLKKSPAELFNQEGTRVADYMHDNYFKNNPQNILGETTKKSGRFGEEDAVEGTIDEAFDRFLETEHAEYAQSRSTNDETVEGIQEDLQESYKEDVYKETHQEEETDIVEDNLNEEAQIETEKKDDGVLDLATVSTVSKEEADMWENITATGELTGAFSKERAFFYRGEYYNRFNYLQGDIYEKLEALETDKAQLTDEQYKKQKEALESVVPELVTADRMNVSPNTRFVQELQMGEKTLAQNFVSWVRSLPHAALGGSSSYSIGQYVDNIPVRGGDKVQNEQERRTRRVQADRLFGLYLTEELSEADRTKVVEEYNRRFNSYVRPDYQQVPLVSKLHNTFNGKPLEIRDVQLQGVGFLTNKGVGLLAHDVGVGKTMQAIIAINEVLERGWAKRPLIVVPNINVYNQWVAEIKEIIPDVKLTLLANLGGDFKGDLATLEIPEGTISIVTQEGFKKLGFSSETYDDLTSDFFDVIRDPNQARKTERQRELEASRAEEEVGKGIRGTTDVREFEQLEFDHITVDEVHNANHIIGRAKMEDKSKVSEFRGFQLRPSQYGIKMWLATQYILKNNNNRNVTLLSATPFTNHPLEYYSIMSLMARERMQRMGIKNVNDFMSMFMDLTVQHEFKADGSYIEKNEVRSFKNYQQFQKLLTEFIDFRDGADAGVDRPTRVPKEYVVPENRMMFEFKQEAQQLFQDEDAGTLKAINELRAIAFSPFLSRYYTGALPSPKEFVEGSPNIKLTTDLIKQTISDNPTGGQLVYSTIGVEYFPLIRDYLIETTPSLKKGDVEIISGATPKKKRSAIQERFNEGKTRVVIGSDAIQEGVNLQKNTHDLYILSLPWNFTALRQVIGRAWRHGNQWTKLRINNVFIENSIGTFLSQKLQNKEKRYEETLRSQLDEVDVGDIDFEELKFDLITDPVIKAELDLKFRDIEIRNEIKRIEADVAFKNRKAQKYVEAQEKVKQYKDYAKDEPEDGYWADQLKKAQDKADEVATELKERGVNVDTVQSEIEASNKEIAELEKRIENLDQEKEQRMKEAEEERENALDTSKEADIKRYVDERAQDNNTFFRAKPHFERYAGAIDGASADYAWARVIGEKLTQEEFDAYLLANAGEIPTENVELLKSANRKYLDFKEAHARPQFELSTGILEHLEGYEAVSKQFISDLANQKDIKKPERDLILETLAEMPDGAQTNAELFRNTVASKLLDLTADTVREDDTIDADAYRHVALSDSERGKVAQYEEKIYQSPIKNGSANIHFSEDIFPRYFAHTRIEDMARGSRESADTVGGEGTTRRVIEVQSDLFQRGRLEEERQYPTLNITTETLKETEKDLEAKVKSGSMTQEEADALLEKEKEFKRLQDERDEELEALVPYRNTWWQRIIREEIKQAGLDGKTKLQFPTGETAMKIEGLGADSSRWIDEETGDPLTPSDVVEGKEIRGVVNAQGTDVWVIVDDRGNGQFRAVERSILEDALRDVQPSEAKEMSGKELLDANIEQADDVVEIINIGETFDVSEGVDENSPIFKFYEKDVQRYLRRIRSDLRKVTDDRGVEWFETAITEQDKDKPVLAFKPRRFREFKRQATTVEEQIADIKEISERLKVTIPVGKVSEIYTGDRDITFEDNRGRARGVSFDGAIFLTEGQVTNTTGVHEAVHHVLSNFQLFDVFEKEGITLDKVYRAANGGRDYTREDILDLQEKLAEMGEQYYAGKRQSSIPQILVRFFEQLRIILSRIQRAFGGETDTIQDFFRVLNFARSERSTAIETPVGIENINSIARRTPTGDLVLDFDLLGKMQDMQKHHSGFFEAYSEADINDEIPGGRDRRRKDINILEQYTAQARDVYLKDPNEFAVAKTYEEIGDARRRNKAALDNRFSEMVAPYMKLKKSAQERVSAILMKGDEEGVEYDADNLRFFGLSKEQQEAYFAVRKTYNIAHELLLQEMARNGVTEEEIDEFRRERVGYMPHKWDGRFAVKTLELTKDGWQTVSMDTFKSERVAQKEFNKRVENNPDPKNVDFEIDTLDSLDVDFFSEQSLSFEAMKSVMQNAKTSEEVKNAMLESVRNMVKEKGFGRQYIKRSGVQGYKKQDVVKVTSDYLSGLSGFLTKMEAGKKYYDALSTVDARRQKKFYAWLRDSIAYDMGQTKEWRKLRTVAFIWYLANDISFLATNSTQNIIVGLGELSKHLKGGDKVIKPEAMLVKAVADWSVKNVTPEERSAIEGLLAVGDLGGEMVAELMAFKNNPLYTEISHWFRRGLYKSTAFVETHVNRVPAFLAARRIFKTQGLTDKEANEKALEVSNDIHFRYGRQNRPKVFRGAVGGSIFVFNHYIRSLLYQLYRDVSRRDFIAFSRKMLYTTALGGTVSLPFAKLLTSIFKSVFDDNDDEEGKEEMTKWELALKRGLPAAFTQVDLSGRVGIELLSLNNVVEDPNDIRSYIGAALNLIWINPFDPVKSGRLGRAIDLARQGRGVDFLGQALPDFLANPFKAYAGYTWGVRSFRGTPLETVDGDLFKYNTWEAIIKATGFSPIRETLSWEAKAEEWRIDDKKSTERARIRGAVRFEVAQGNIEEAREIQAEALADGIITDNIDYVREFAKDLFIDEALESIEAGGSVSEAEDKLIQEIYGDEASDQQRNNIRKDLAVFRVFGREDDLANSLMSASTNAEKAQLLIQARQEMSEEDFRAFFTNARKELRLESGRKSPILISDALRELYLEEKSKL